eukprot:Cvel_19966.t1-p1 / transcript=Cvel_19966.t1 / gene=Cvel_19966 / organism=Chromera_velia_CCMP2878 / gene_product=hypothetical protein / transcript_product=hypothetical protein / location=Cvel_scaffold1758:485-7985(-) / protein_length=718 / sequence_SO=supercontig / SO=protein_coding / is_pseudo=false
MKMYVSPPSKKSAKGPVKNFMWQSGPKPENSFVWPYVGNPSLERALLGILCNEEPQDEIWLVGAEGVGKTSMIERVIAEAQAVKPTPVVLRVNGEEVNRNQLEATLEALASVLMNGLVEQGSRVMTGIPDVPPWVFSAVCSSSPGKEKATAEIVKRGRSIPPRSSLERSLEAAVAGLLRTSQPSHMQQTGQGRGGKTKQRQREGDTGPSLGSSLKANERVQLRQLIQQDEKGDRGTESVWQTPERVFKEVAGLSVFQPQRSTSSSSSSPKTSSSLKADRKFRTRGDLESSLSLLRLMAMECVLLEAKEAASRGAGRGKGRGAADGSSSFRHQKKTGEEEDFPSPADDVDSLRVKAALVFLKWMMNVAQSLMKDRKSPVCLVVENAHLILRSPYIGEGAREAIEDVLTQSEIQPASSDRKKEVRKVPVLWETEDALCAVRGLFLRPALLSSGTEEERGELEEGPEVDASSGLERQRRIAARNARLRIFGGGGGSESGRSQKASVGVVELSGWSEDLARRLFVPNVIEDEKLWRGIWTAVGGNPALLHKTAEAFGAFNHEHELAEWVLHEPDEDGKKKKIPEDKETSLGLQPDAPQADIQAAKKYVAQANFARGLPDPLLEDVLKAESRLQWVASSPLVQAWRKQFADELSFRFQFYETLRLISSRPHLPVGDLLAVSDPLVLALLDANLLRAAVGPPQRLMHSSELSRHLIEDWVNLKC